MTLSDFLKTTTQAAFAETLGVTQSLVSQWLTGDTVITAERAKQIEEQTRGKVTRTELRPDVFGPINKPPDRKKAAA